MKPKLTPRIYYTLNTSLYFSNYFKKKLKDNPLLNKNNKIYYTNLARTSLILLLKSISKNKLNIAVQAFNCYSVFQAIIKAGHKPVFIDLTDQLKLDLDDLRNKVHGIDVLIVTHTFGFPENMDQIKKIIGEKIIIEDCAHSFLSKYQGEYTGTLGDASIFSIGLGKFPPIGSNGFCIINTPYRFPFFEIEYSKLKKSKLTSSIKDFIKILLLSIAMKPPIYGIFIYSLRRINNSKIDIGGKFSFSKSKGNQWVQNIFSRNFSYFVKMCKVQTKNAKYLSSIIKIKNFLLISKNHNSPNNFAFPLLIENRDLVYDKLLERNIEPGKHFHNSIKWATEFGYVKGDCPGIEKIVNKIITVPIHMGVSRNKLSKIAKIINENTIN